MTWQVIYTACVDQERGRYVAWLQDAAGLKSAESHTSQEDAVAQLILAYPETFRIRVHRDAFSTNRKEPPV